jgi:hypothetical protein
MQLVEGLREPLEVLRTSLVRVPYQAHTRFEIVMNLTQGKLQGETIGVAHGFSQALNESVDRPE